MNTPEKYTTDEALLKGIRAEEDESFNVLYQRYFPMIQHLILKNNGQLEDAKDIFQEAVIQLFINARSRGFQLTSKLGTYLYSIARNKWMESLRKNANTELVEIQDTESDFVDINETDEIPAEEKRIQKMEELLLKLTEECRKVLRLYYFSRLSLDDISKAMNYTYEFAKKKKSRCLKKLREWANTHWPEL